jgi:hypothetical protein
MDNLTTRLRELSLALTKAEHELDAAVNIAASDEDIQLLQDRVDDILDEIEDIENVMRGEAEDEYADHRSKGWR